MVGGGNQGRNVFKARALRKSKHMRFSLRTKQKIVALGLGLISWAVAGAAQSQVDWKKEWERSLQEAKKEGVIVVGIPARAELRKELEAVFKPRFGIDMDLSTARGPQNASKIAAEFAAGVKNFDVFIGGSGSLWRPGPSRLTEPLDVRLSFSQDKEAKSS